jgi:hypothetical protein
LLDVTQLIQLPLAADEVEIAFFDGEVVVFHIPNKMVHRLIGVAAGVWLLADGATPLAQMCNELAEAFGTTVDEMTATVDDAVQSLWDAQLINDAANPIHRQVSSDVHVDGALRDADGTRIEARQLDP